MAKLARRVKRSGAARADTSKGGVVARAYTSPTLVLLAMDWPDGAKFDDFLGFAILRAPGFNPGEKDGFLFNKISFTPPTERQQPLPSNLAPFQKFMWWDAGINDARSRQDIQIHDHAGSRHRAERPQALTQAAATIKVTAAERRGGRHLDLVQSRRGELAGLHARIPRSQEEDRRRDEVARQRPAERFPRILPGANAIDGAIYHLTDKNG